MSVEAPAAPRSPWQRLYAAGHRWRQRHWAARAERLPAPVWSIGNLHWGGTGKTPLVLAVAAWLRDRGARVAVLSRGYGRRGGAPLLVSRGDGPLAGPAATGDEPWLLADELRGVAVAVASRRADAGRLLLAALDPPPQLFLLDDGFSHLRLHRDLDLLALPAADPFGGGRLPPAGRLREPLTSARRAGALLLTGADASADAARRVAEALRPWGFAGRGFACPTLSGAPRPVSGPGRPPAGASDDGEGGGRLLLVTGVASPGRVRASAEEQGVALAGHVAFRDHCPYGERELREIARAAAAARAGGILTTAKDRVKLAGRTALPLWELPVAARPEPAFWEWLAGELEGALGRSG